MTKLDGLDRSLLRPGNRFCCAVSGGADSVALLLSLVDANAAKESSGLVLSAIHVHHGLRGAEADSDEDFVRALCARLAVPLTVERVDTAARQAVEREGVEEAARELRYAAFWRLLRAGTADSVATAHTLNDQAETVLMKLLRGAWTEGLSGIHSTISDVKEGTNGSSPGNFAQPGPLTGCIVRPLLNVHREEIEAFLRARGQGWCEDSSNQSMQFTRNRIRHELMPLLRTFNPGIDETLARTAGIAQGEEEFWRTELARLLPGLLLPGKPVRGGGRAVGTGVGERCCALELDRVRTLAPAVRSRVVRAAALSVGCRLSSVETAKLLGLGGLAVYPGISGRIGAKLELAGGLRAERSARELRLSRVEPNLRMSTPEGVDIRGKIPADKEIER